jgi:hypothetical protein
LRHHSVVGNGPPSTSTPHCPACLARRCEGPRLYEYARLGQPVKDHLAPGTLQAPDRQAPQPEPGVVGIARETQAPRTLRLVVAWAADREQEDHDHVEEASVLGQKGKGGAASQCQAQRYCANTIYASVVRTGVLPPYRCGDARCTRLVRHGSGQRGAFRSAWRTDRTCPAWCETGSIAPPA